MLHSTTPASGVARDPNDDMIIARAINGRADTIVSRDNDMLSLGISRGLPIISLETVRHQLRGPDHPQ
jgi:predicted nucleic acid-binding protein